MLSRRLIVMFVCCLFFLFGSGCGSSKCVYHSDCGAGSYCGRDGTCSQGCKQDSDCGEGESCSLQGRCISASGGLERSPSGDGGPTEVIKEDKGDGGNPKPPALPDVAVRPDVSVRPDVPSQPEVPGKVCNDGEERSCFTGSQTLLGVGTCEAGKQYCKGGRWSICVDDVLPSKELCDGRDNDCDGEVDEDVKPCVTTGNASGISLYASKGIPGSSHHKGAIRALSWNPQGTVLAATGQDKIIKLWDPATKKLLKALSGHQAQIRSIAWSPSGDRIAACSDDGTIRLWSYQTGKSALVITVGKSSVTSLVWSRDGKNLISGSKDGEIHVWDVATGNLARSFGKDDKKFGFVRSLAMSFDGKFLAAGDALSSEIRLWDLASKKDLGTLQGHSGPIGSLQFHPTKQLLVSGSADGSLVIWDVATKKQEKSFQTTQGVEDVVWSPDGKKLASTHRTETTVKLWSVELGNQRQTFFGGKKVLLHSLAWKPNGNIIASGGTDGSIKFWDLNNKKNVKMIEGFASAFSGFSLGSDGLLFSLGRFPINDGAKLWNTETGKLLKSFVGHTKEVSKTAISPQGNILATTSRDKTIKLWDLRSGRLLKTFRVQGMFEPSFLSWSPDGTKLASGGFGSHIQLWDTKTRTLSTAFQRINGVPRSLSWGPNSNVLLVCNAHKASLFNTKTGKEIQSFLVPESGKSFMTAASDPHGNFVATGDIGGGIKVWNAKTGVLVAELIGHQAHIRSLAWSSNGSVLISGSSDRTIRLWDAANGKLLKTLPEQTGKILHVQFLTNNQIIAAVTGDYKLLFWK